MKKLLSMFIAALLFTIHASAQFPYTVSAKKDVYTALSGGTAISGGVSWTKKTKFSVPIGFNFKIGAATVTQFSIVAGKMFATDTVGNVSGFMLTDADILSKGASPISYTVTGTTPNRIFKAEVLNAGFELEQIKHTTFDDYIDMQIWLYEGTNVVEIRTGPSKVTYPFDYYHMGMPIIGYAANYRIDSDKIYNMYILAGDPLAPTTDSINRGHGDTTQEALLRYPSSGIVYTYTPRTTGIKTIAEENNYVIYPTICNDVIIVNSLYGMVADYNIISLSGTIINITGTIRGDKNRIDISKLPVGIYFLQLQNESGRVLQKFVKL